MDRSLKILVLMVVLVIAGELLCNALGFSFIAQMHKLLDIVYNTKIHPAFHYLFGV